MSFKETTENCCVELILVVEKNTKKKARKAMPKLLGLYLNLDSGIGLK
jgi:hypothetical protein